MTLVYGYIAIIIMVNIHIQQLIWILITFRQLILYRFNISRIFV